MLPPPHLLASIPLANSQHAQPGGLNSLTGQLNASPPAPVSQLLPTTPSSASGGLILSPAAAPFPSKLVEKCRSGQFIEMRELLADNITLLQQLEAMQGTHPVNMIGPTRPRLREVSTLTTWLYCFLAYAAIITSDATTRNLLAYARLIMREALRHNNNGWLDYDRSFRQQAAVDPSLPWNTLVPGLQASMILGNPTRQGFANQRQQCTLCRGFDHARSDCALSYLHPYTRTPQRNPYRICTSWNRGNCVYPGSCSFRHVCATCQLLHKARDCPKTPETSMYKQKRVNTPAQS